MPTNRLPKVLLADDENHIRTLIKTVLNMIQFQVIGEAKNGKEAIEMVSQLKPDMLLLDINMPIKTGQEALPEIVRNFPKLVVIMLSSVADMDSIERCLEVGAANFIRKDTPIPEIKTIVQETWQAFLDSQEACDA